MTEQELQAIKERVENTTKGPWKVVKSEESGVQIGTTWEHGQLKAGVPVVTTAHGVGGTTIYINQNNAEFIAHAREDVPALIAEVERLRETLQTIAFTPKFKLQCEAENYAELALEGRESEWVEVPFDSELKILREAFDHKTEVHDALNRDYVKVRDENERLREALEFYADIENHQNNFLGSKISRIDLDAGNTAAKVLAGESNE